MSAADFTVLSLIPPMTQLNTPYPSTAYLTGFLRSRGVRAVQDDLALKLVLRLLSGPGLEALRQAALAGTASAQRVRKARPAAPSASVAHFLSGFDRYRATIDPTIAFLQGRDPTLAHRINARAFLPEGPRFASLDRSTPPRLRKRKGATPWAGPLVRWACRTGRGTWPRST